MPTGILSGLSNRLTIATQGNELSKLSNFIKEPRFSKIRIAVMVLGLFAVLEIGVRVYFTQPNLVNRNAGNNDQAMVYLLDQLDRYEGKGTRVAFIGSSVMQGYINADADKTFAAMSEKMLREKYGRKNLRVFNLATAGNGFGDHLCILNRVLKSDPDLIVHAIHFKLFSTHLNTRINRPENIYYLAGAKDFGKYLTRFNIAPKQFLSIYLDKSLGHFFKLYGHKDLIVHLLTGSERVAMDQTVRAYQGLFGFLTEEAMLAQIHTPKDHNQEYLWKLLPEGLMKQNYEICGNFNFTESNPAWLSFEDENKMAKDAGQTIAWYMTPMNKPFIDEAFFFDWQKIVPSYKESIYHVIRRNGHRLYDYSNAVYTANFSDTDHINMAGHAQVASRLARDIDQQLRSRKRR